VFIKQTRYSDEQKLKIIDEARSSGNITATAKRYSISESIGRIRAIIP
jgi:transposase-like protein